MIVNDVIELSGDEIMEDRFRFFLNRIGEKLWVKPFVMCILSIASVFLSKLADDIEASQFIPNITLDSIEALLSIISSSMLVIATFAVASMVSAYASASSVATPRSFSLIISDDVSQNALSTFIGAFIFSIVALIALKNGYYEQAGRFALFVLTLLIFSVVIITFVRWVDCIARLGRLGETRDKVEAATAAALRRRRYAPTLCGTPVETDLVIDQVVYGNVVGYVQRIDVAALQVYAEEVKIRITVVALPGTFSAPGQAIAYITVDPDDVSDINVNRITQAFLIDNDRKFDEDPRFGLIVLSEIASRAMSPAINDPGTAIGIIGVFVRLFTLWSEPISEGDIQTSKYSRVAVPEISLEDMFDDAFTAIARDGAGTVEVAIRLQKAFESLASMENSPMRVIAIRHARLALVRAEKTLGFPEDLERVRRLVKFTDLS